MDMRDDPDTTGAVYGQIAGAFYGASGIPANWLSRLHGLDMIESFADRLEGGAERHGSQAGVTGVPRGAGS
jgi:ADP-ribosylglycohydrolase